ncbi:MAG: polysaccharide pyruvyl transferase family protein [Lachnospiraceae bacterium]|nr:polysaccharide pyruvyl transferase family protein [Lachnospiraceae bacterium]
MIRIGVLTFQNANSMGAVSQTYALQETLRKLGAEVHIINYASPYMQLQARQTCRFKEFTEKYLYLTPLYKSGEEIDCSQFDEIIVGSDQVWNPILTNYDNTYFLDFAGPEIVKVAYAASVGINTFPEGSFREPFEKYVQCFDAISVRESVHMQSVMQYAQCPVLHTLDPTLLLSGEEYTSAFALGESDEEYIFLYQIGMNSKLLDYANIIALQYNCKLIAYTKYGGGCYVVQGTKVFFDITPEQWLEYIKNAKLVLTDSYHGMNLSIIFQRPFYILTEVTYNMVRILDSLTQLKLGNRRLSQLSDVRDVNFTIDYAEANKILEAGKEESLAFLKVVATLTEE